VTSGEMQPESNPWRALDAARGLLITLIGGVIGYFAIVPAPASSRFWISHNGLLQLSIGVALQLAIVVGRPLLTRYERAHGLEGQLSPMLIHVLQLVADGASVLLFALAVFGGIASFENGI